MLRVTTIVILISGCAYVQEEVAQALIENMDFQYIDKYDYEYTQRGDIKYRKLMSYKYANTTLIDSTFVITKYEYDTMGRLVEETNKIQASGTGDNKDILIFLTYLSYPPKILYRYNDMDSVIANYELNQFGDTIKRVEKEYVDEKVVTEFTRHIDFLPNESSKISMDTTYLYKEFVYEDSKLKRIIENDKSGYVTSVEDFIYQDTLLIKKVKYDSLFDQAVINEITEYDYANDPENPDVTIKKPEPLDFIISLKKSIRLNGQKVVIHFRSEEFSVDSTFYNTAGHPERSVHTNFETNTKIKKSFRHNKNGNVIYGTSKTTKINTFY